MPEFTDPMADDPTFDGRQPTEYGVTKQLVAAIKALDGFTDAVAHSNQSHLIAEHEDGKRFKITTDELRQRKRKS